MYKKILVFMAAFGLLLCFSTAEASAAKIHVDSEVKVKKILKKYAKNVNISSVKGSILDMDGDTVQINIKGGQNLTGKLMTKEPYMNICKVYMAVKKADFSNFSNIGVAVKIDGHWAVKTDTNPDTLKSISNHDLNYNYNNLPSYTTHIWQSNDLPKIQ